MIYAYLRVSSTAQDELNQRQGIDKYSLKNNISIEKYVIDKVSGTKEPEQRKLGLLLKKLKKDDVLLISEISRLSRRVFMLFRILEKIIKNGVTLYSVKENFKLDTSLQSKAMIFAFGLAAEIERELISQRTKEALNFKKTLGVKLGRPKGALSKIHKLDGRSSQIASLLKKGWSKAKIARKLKVSDKTLRKYLKHNF